MKGIVIYMDRQLFYFKVLYRTVNTFCQHMLLVVKIYTEFLNAIPSMIQIHVYKYYNSVISYQSFIVDT